MRGSDFIYAIDFGTSNSLLGGAHAGGVEPLAPLDPQASDPHVLRSLLYFEPGQEPSFGTHAMQRYVENSLNGRFLRSFKRFLPSKAFEGTTIGAKHWRLEELVARFLREMRERANAHYGRDVEAAVFGRPALFSEDAESERLAQTRLEEAARLAGFKHIDFLPEPVAAAYRYRHEMKREEIVLVADFGGGTSDYTIIKLSDREFRPEDVLAIGGAPVAGDALDGAVMKHRVAKHFGSEVNYRAPFGSQVLTMPRGVLSYLCSTAHIQFLNAPENRAFLNQVRAWSLGDEDRRVMDQLRTLLENQLGFSIFEAIEAAKRKLSTGDTAEIRFEYPDIDIREPLKQKHFESDTRAETERIFSALDATLARAGLKAEQIHRICCTGGTAKASVVRKGLKSRFAEDRLDNFRNFTSIVEGLCERGRQLL